MRTLGDLLRAAVLSLVLSSGAAAEPLLWLCPMDPFARPGLFEGSPDFMALFADDAAWPKAAAHVDVFKLYPQFVLQASDADLAAVIQGLKARHIALALEFGFLGDTALCGKIEGHCGETIGRVAERIKRLGGDLAYLAMDEPLWFGHVVEKSGIPRATIGQVARDVARQVATLRRSFPDVRIGDIEPLGDRGAPAEYFDEIGSWLGAFEAEAGSKLDFFHADVTWRARSVDDVRTLAALVRGNRIAFGVIYNGSPKDSTDVDWTETALRHARDVERDLMPDHVILQTWMAHPHLALPETRPGTMTALVDGYVALHEGLSVGRAD